MTGCLPQWRRCVDSGSSRERDKDTEIQKLRVDVEAPDTTMLQHVSVQTQPWSCIGWAVKDPAKTALHFFYDGQSASMAGFFICADFKVHFRAEGQSPQLPLKKENVTCHTLVSWSEGFPQ